MLAGMIHAPSETDPLHNPDMARKRAAAVLDAMVANGKITPAQAMVAKLEPATVDPAAVAPPSTGWFADWVYGKVAAAVVSLGGTMQVRTTLDLRLQQAAVDAVNTVLSADGARQTRSEAALVAMRPDGAVVAMVGGRNYAASQFNRAVQAKRQPGSAFKLFDYYAALRHGLTPNDEILDAPIEVAQLGARQLFLALPRPRDARGCLRLLAQCSHRAAVATGRHRSGHSGGARSRPAGAAAQDAEPRVRHLGSQPA